MPTPSRSDATNFGVCPPPPPSLHRFPEFFPLLFFLRIFLKILLPLPFFPLLFHPSLASPGRFWQRIIFFVSREEMRGKDKKESSRLPMLPFRLKSCPAKYGANKIPTSFLPLSPFLPDRISLLKILGFQSRLLTEKPSNVQHGQENFYFCTFPSGKSCKCVSSSHLSLHSVMACGKGSKSSDGKAASDAAAVGPGTDTTVAAPAAAAAAAAAVAVAPGATGVAACRSDGCRVSISGCSDWYLATPAAPLVAAGVRCTLCGCDMLGRCEVDTWYQFWWTGAAAGCTRW